MADDEYEADPCHSDYDYNYDTIDECDNIYDTSPSNYQELISFDEKYKLEERSDERDEFIFTNVFNNYNISTEILVDFNIGTMEEWTETCKKFNSGQMELSFATIYICIFNNGTAYNSVVLICNNIHPFAELNKQQDEVAELTNLLHTAVIHN